MKNDLLKDIMRFSMTKKKLSEKSIYLFKGFLFAPFFKKASRRSTGNEIISAKSLAGDDIYPLF